VTTALIVESYKNLSAPPDTKTVQLLDAILRKMENSSLPSDISSAPFSASVSAVIINSLFFLSLSASLLAALGAILIKQWTRNFSTRINHITSPRQRARLRHRRVQGIEAWRFAQVIAWIPMMLHISLFLFFAGLLIWLWYINLVVFIIIVAVSGTSLLLYIATAVTPSFDPDSPFIWPFSSLIQMALPLRGNNEARRLSEGVSLDRIGSGIAPIIATPIQDLSMQTVDPVDSELVSRLLEQADTNTEVEAALDQIRMMLTASLHTYPTKILTQAIRRGADLALSCGVYTEGQPDIQPGTGFQRASTIIRFFEVVLQTPIDVTKCIDSLRSVAKVAQIFHNRAMKAESAAEIGLSASCLARLEAIIGDDASILKQVEAGPLIMERLTEVGPYPPYQPTQRNSTSQKSTLRKSRSRKWSIDEIRQYQTLVCAYLASFMRMLLAYDSKGLRLRNETLKAIKLDGKILIENSRDIDGRIAGNQNHPLLLEILRAQWIHLHGDNSRDISVVVKYFLLTLGHEPPEHGDGSWMV
jgi:hypothetical protein